METLPGLETPIPEDKHPVRTRGPDNWLDLADTGHQTVTPPGFQSPQFQTPVGTRYYLPPGQSNEDSNQSRSYQSHQTEHHFRPNSPLGEDSATYGAKEVMEHIIITLLEEHLIRAPSTVHLIAMAIICHIT